MSCSVSRAGENKEARENHANQQGKTQTQQTDKAEPHDPAPGEVPVRHSSFVEGVLKTSTVKTTYNDFGEKLVNKDNRQPRRRQHKTKYAEERQVIESGSMPPHTETSMYQRRRKQDEEKTTNDDERRPRHNQQRPW